MSSDDLMRFVMNAKPLYEETVFAVRMLRRMIDSAAKKLAQANAAWHDDPGAEDHAEFHAPAEQQFPRDVRDAAILELVKHYLGEITLAEQGKGKDGGQ